MRMRPPRNPTPPFSPTEAYDPIARAAEKPASRDADELALASGSKTREDLARANGAFAFPYTRIDLSAAAKVLTGQTRKQARRARTKARRAARAERTNRYERALTFLAVADGQPIRRGVAYQTHNARRRARTAEKP